MHAKRDYLYLAFSFFLPLAIMGIAFAIVGVYPFGKWQIFMVDFVQQYYPFFSELWHKLREGSSLLWSWTSGGGISYLGQIAYYLASPLNLLIVLFTHAWLGEVLTVLIMVKIGLSGLFFAMYLRYTFGRCDISLPMFSLFYALCSYMLGYYSNIMWLDTFALLPLVMLGIHALVREGKWRLYVAALALSVFCNYYIGLFTCIFTAIMFFVLCITEKVSKTQLLQKIARIAICSAIAIGLTAVLTVPTFLQLLNTAGSSDSFPSHLRNLGSYVDILGNFVAFAPPTSIAGLPNISCGMLSILLLGVFIRSEKINLRRKMAYIVILVFLVVSLNLNVLYFIWHGFRFPNALPYRFSFLVSFTIVLMAYHAYCIMDEVDWRDVLAMIAASVFFHAFAVFGTQNPMFTFRGHDGFGTMTSQDIISSASLSAGYILLFALRIPLRPSEQGHEPFLNRRVFAPLLLLLVLVEFVLTAHLAIALGRSDFVIREEYPEQGDNVQYLLNLREPDPNGFSRTEFTMWYTFNDPALYGYDGISVFSSFANDDTASIMRDIGFYSGYREKNLYIYSSTTPFNDALLNIKYLINRTGMYDSDSIYWEQVAASEHSLLLENRYYLPLGFMVARELADYVSAENDPFGNQNEIFMRATGLDGDLLTHIDATDAEHIGYDVTKIGTNAYSFALREGREEGILMWSFNLPAAGDYYLFFKIDYSSCAEGLVIMAGEETLRRAILYMNPLLYPLGTFEEGEVITVCTDFNNALYANLVRDSLDGLIGGEAFIDLVKIDHELFERGYEILSAETLELTEFSDTRVKGTITTSQAGLLYTSIPYEKGWKAYVSGGSVEIIAIEGAMLAVPLGTGEHEIEFRYFPDGLTAGIIISLLSILAVAVMAMTEKRVVTKMSQK